MFPNLSRYSGFQGTGLDANGQTRMVLELEQLEGVSVFTSFFIST